MLSPTAKKCYILLHWLIIIKEYSILIFLTLSLQCNETVNKIWTSLKVGFSIFGHAVTGIVRYKHIYLKVIKSIKCKVYSMR